MNLKFHSETPIVSGYNRSCIYDLPRQKYDFVPNDVIKTLKNNINEDYFDLQIRLDDNHKLWLEFLIENEYCFLVPDFFINSFPNIDFKWDSPSEITNAIIDLENLDLPIDFKVFEQINCKHILLRFIKNHSVVEITDYLRNTFSKLTFKSIDIILPDSLKGSSRNNNIVFKKIASSADQITSIKFFEQNIKSQIKNNFTPFFSININVYSEAILRNVYFNRKIYIDNLGNIRNAIETKRIFGNLFSNDFYEVLKNIKKSKLWLTNKDKIDVCKNCEFRYMCIDNRIPTKRSNGSYYFEQECSYNPYISKWKGELSYLSLKNTGVLLNNEICLIDHTRLKEINKLLWNTNE